MIYVTVTKLYDVLAFFKEEKEKISLKIIVTTTRYYHKITTTFYYHDIIATFMVRNLLVICLENAVNDASLTKEEKEDMIAKCNN